MIINKEINDYLEILQPFTFKTYEIILHLDSPIALYDNLHLDSLLTKSITDKALDGKQLKPSAEPYWLPLPLKQAWSSDIGMPLWCCTDFYPLEYNEIVSEFWHKRTVSTAFLPKQRGGRPINLRPGEGATKEYRIPLPVHICRKWRATFVGDAEIVSMLLQDMGSLGKKRSQGYGIIKSWEINIISTFSFFDNNKPLRPIPTVYIPDRIPTDVSYIGYSPPYWLSAGFLLCHTPVLYK